MTTASLELCRELYELSGWEDTEKLWQQLIEISTKNPRAHMRRFLGEGRLGELMEGIGDTDIPAYDAGYLLRKLPQYVKVGHALNGYSARFDRDDGKDFKNIHISTSGEEMGYKIYDTPEDALCQLAIELFKKGVLK